MSNIHVIGISSPIAFSEKARSILREADVIVSPKRLLRLFSESEESAGLMGKCRVADGAEKTVSLLKKLRKDAVLLASGDPLFFGIGKRLIEEIPDKNVEIYPAVSSVQSAFSKAKAPWDDAFFVSLHGSKKRQWALNDLPLLCEMHGKLAVLTGGENTPARIAGVLPQSAEVYVFERLGCEGERVRKGSPAAMRKMRFREPNLMLIIPPRAGHLAFGLMEGEFGHIGGLITKDEVRAVVIHKLRLPRKGVLWDIGAGSGSVSIEAKRLAPGIEAYAIEKNTSAIRTIKANIRGLNPGNIAVVRGEAPEALSGLPSPDRVFIGGAGRRLGPIIRYVSKRLTRGVIVMTAITLESIAEAVSELKRLGLQPEVSSVSVSRAFDLKGRRYMKALNPVFIIRAIR